MHLLIFFLPVSAISAVFGLYVDPVLLPPPQAAATLTIKAEGDLTRHLRGALEKLEAASPPPPPPLPASVTTPTPAVTTTATTTATATATATAAATGTTTKEAAKEAKEVAKTPCPSAKTAKGKGPPILVMQPNIIMPAMSTTPTSSIDPTRTSTFINGGSSTARIQSKPPLTTPRLKPSKSEGQVVGRINGATIVTMMVMVVVMIIVGN